MFVRNFALLLALLGCQSGPAPLAPAPLAPASAPVPRIPQTSDEPEIASGSDEPSGSENKVQVEIELSPCRSIAPAYTLRIHRDGTVVFVGSRNVTALGDRRGQIDEAAREALRARIEKHGLRNASEHYRCEPTAGFRCSMHPCFVTLRVELDGELKSVTWSDDVRGLPPSLSAIVADVVATAGAAEWIGDSERR
jgi:hypothetical protein